MTMTLYTSNTHTHTHSFSHENTQSQSQNINEDNSKHVIADISDNESDSDTHKTTRSWFHTKTIFTTLNLRAAGIRATGTRPVLDREMMK